MPIHSSCALRANIAVVSSSTRPCRQRGRPAQNLQLSRHQRVPSSAFRPLSTGRGYSVGRSLASCSAEAESPWFGVAPGDTFTEEYGTVPKADPKGRRAGVVLHPTSLPGPYGTGEIGKEANKFIDWLASADMSIWQVLPLVPPGRPIPGIREDYWSPYSGQDANAGNVLLLSLEGLVELGLLHESDLPEHAPQSNCDFDYVVTHKEPLLYKAADNLLANMVPPLTTEFRGFVSDPEISAWLDDAALFAAIGNTPELLGVDWWEWPVGLRDREAAAMKEIQAKLTDSILQYKALQFLFEKQWNAVKAYATTKGVKILGDMPIYVAGHSADVWANRELFTLKEDGKAELVSGVPPDAFSETGQLWGSPLYDWQAHIKEDFAWWKQRMSRALSLYDEVRIDHFRAMTGYWAVDAQAETAMNGTWKAGPGIALFDALKEKIGDENGDMPIIAEDLGVITPDVVELREDINAPGMVVLQFAFGGGASNIHLPHNHYPNSVVYPGTHDNDTCVGWFESLDAKTAKHVTSYTMSDPDSPDFKPARMMTQLAMSSVADTCIICLQDVVGLDASARMNTPGVADGNWAWRWLKPFDSLEAEAAELRMMCKDFGRTPPREEEEEEQEEEEQEEGETKDANESTVAEE